MDLVIISGAIALLTAALAIATWYAFTNVSEADLANRWFTHMKRSVMTVTGVLTVVTLLAEPSIALIVPLFVLVLLIGLYPARSKVFGETRSLWSYLAFQLRLVTVFGGTWLAIALLPELVRLAPGPSALVAPAGAVFTFAVMWLIGRFYPQILGARPLERADVLEAFAPVTARARCAAPALFAVEPEGAHFANAIALPSPTKPRVLFGTALFEHLSTAELAAVYGHELSHLEHYDQRYLRKVSAAMTSLIVVAAALTPLLETLGKGAARNGALAWPLVVFAGWLAWMASRQAHEGDCDVRAIELTGDGEHMIAGLTKLHALARVPNRLSPDEEASNSHPTLERRIARIRAAMSGAPQASTAKPETTLDSPWPTLLLGMVLLFAPITLDMPLAFAALAPLCAFSKSTRAVLYAIIATSAAFLAIWAIGNIDDDDIGQHAVFWVVGIATIAIVAAVRAQRNGPGQPAGALALIVLGIGAIPSALMILVFASAGAELHFAITRAPDLALYCAAFAGTLSLGSDQRRIAAVAFALIALLAIASTASLYTTLTPHDPLLVRAPALEPMPTKLAPIRTFTYPARIGAIQFSHSGRWAILKRVVRQDEVGEDVLQKGFELIDLHATAPFEHSRHFQLANYGYIAFIDDDRALVLEAKDDVVLLSTLRLADLQQSGERIDIPMELGEAAVPSLTLDPSSGRYTLRNDPDQGNVTRLTGAIGAPPDTRRAHDLVFMHQPVAARGPIAIGYRANANATAADDISPLMFLRALLIKPNLMKTMDVVAATPIGERPLFTTRVRPWSCAAEASDGRYQWCINSIGKSTALLSRIDTTNATIITQRTLPFLASYLHSSGRLLSFEVDDSIYLIDTETLSLRAIEMGHPDCTTHAYLLHDTLATTEICSEASTIRFSPLPASR